MESTVGCKSRRGAMATSAAAVSRAAIQPVGFALLPKGICSPGPGRQASSINPAISTTITALKITTAAPVGYSE